MRIHRDYHAHPLVLIKLAFGRLCSLVEFCHRCGRVTPIVWWAHQELWDEVTGMGEAGIRCPECFDRECRDRGVQLRWRPEVIQRADRSEADR